MRVGGWHGYYHRGRQRAVADRLITLLCVLQQHMLPREENRSVAFGHSLAHVPWFEFMRVPCIFAYKHSRTCYW